MFIVRCKKDCFIALCKTRDETEIFVKISVMLTNKKKLHSDNKNNYIIEEI